MGTLKLPGEWDPGIDLGLLPLLESDQNQVQLTLEVLRQLELLTL
jgi:hypothetical protein